MQIIVLSPPSATAEWAVPLIRDIVEAAWGSIDYLQLSTVDALKEAWRKREHEHLMVFTDAPDAQISNILSNSDVPTVAIYEDPVNSADYLRRHMGYDTASGIRLATLSFAALHEAMVNAQHILPISGGNLQSRECLIVQICDFLGLQINDHQLKKLLDFKGSSATEGMDDQTGKLAWTGRIQDNEDSPVFGALLPYRSLQHSAPADAFFWAPELFFTTNPLGESLLGEIDLTGPARPIVYGPYLHLPVGSWDANVLFEIWGNTSRNVLFLEVLSGGRILSSWRTDLPKEGSYELTARLINEEPRLPLEIRISILEGAIEGTFSLRSVRISRA